MVIKLYWIDVLYFWNLFGLFSYHSPLQNCYGLALEKLLLKYMILVSSCNFLKSTMQET